MLLKFISGRPKEVRRKLILLDSVPIGMAKSMMIF